MKGNVYTRSANRIYYQKAKIQQKYFISYLFHVHDVVIFVPTNYSGFSHNPIKTLHATN